MSAVEQQLVKEARAAQILDVSRRTLQDWRLRGGGPPFVRVGRRGVRYRLATLSEWLASREVRSTSELPQEQAD